MATALPVSKGHERLRRGLCAALVVLGLSVMAGWVWAIEPLKSVVPGLSTMKFNAAFGFALTGVGLAAVPYPRLRAVAVVAAVLLAATGLITLAEYAVEIGFSFDELVVQDTGILTGSGHPGRMSPITAFTWFVLGVAILLLTLGRQRRAIVVAHGLASIAALAAILAAAGYAFGAAPYGWIGFYTFMAVHTAIGLMIASGAALMTRANEGWFQPYADSPSAREVLIRLLPLAVILPAGMGLLIILGAGLGAYNAVYGLTLYIPVIAGSLVAVTLWVAGRLREGEAIRRQHERHLELLVAELNHRVKNTLSVVQSFAHQSFKSGRSGKEGVEAFEGRLLALARAHNLLTRENWDTISLNELVRTCLEGAEESTRFDIDGADVPVTPKTAVTIAMTLHELATNSIKYGALSSQSGKVRVHWWSDDAHFHFQWADMDGPVVEAPSRRGFGSRMLERALAGELRGKATLDYRPTGLVYEVEAPERPQL